MAKPRDRCRWTLLGMAWCVVQSSIAAANQASGSGAEANAPAAAQAQFDVMEYRVLGNSVLPVRDIESLLYPLLGEHKQLSDVEVARAALEKLYHDRGYGAVFVDIPPQEVHDGIVRLHVTEATLHARKIDGARYFSEAAVVSALPAAQVGAVPSLTSLQQELTTVNSQTADRSVVPILKAGPVPGTVDLELKVTDTLPLHGSLELDDNYNVDTKPLRATAAVSYGNLFQELDAIALQYQDSPQAPGEVGVFNASYTSRLFDGFRASGYFINSNSDVANIGAGGTGVLGKGQVAGVRLSLPSATGIDSIQTLTLGVDYKHFRNTITETGQSAALVTPITYTNLSISYAGNWRWPVADLALSLAPNFGLRGAPNSAQDFENDRYLARPNYIYLRWDNTLTVHAPDDFRVSLRLAGQVTDEPLISNENYSIGGVDAVRGYLEAEELGDSAEKATLQMQTPTWSWRNSPLVNALAFYDIGRTHEFATLAGQPTHTELASLGAGINLLPIEHLSGNLIWADPLRNGTYTKKGQNRILFSFRGAF